MPEGRFPLAQACSTWPPRPSPTPPSPFSTPWPAWKKSSEADVPNHLKDGNRDKEGFGHGEGYLYPHAYRDHWVAQQYLPDALQGKVFYQPSDQGYERANSRRGGAAARGAVGGDGGEHRLVDLTLLGAELAARIVAAEEAIYAAADDPLVNWDEAALYNACGAAGLSATITVEDEISPTPITPGMLARWFTPAASDRPSYADHLGRLLTSAEVTQVRDLFQRQLAGQQVAWSSRTLIVTGRRASHGEHPD
jgi:hypothetical protein